MQENKHLVIIGPGKIGRGYLADAFAPLGWHLTFIGHRPSTIEALRKQGYYTVFKMGKEGMAEYRISGYDALCSATEREACIDALCQTQLAALPIYPDAYGDIALLLAEAVKERRRRGIQQPLNIAFCVNYVGATHIFRNRILDSLHEAADKAYFETHIGLSDALTQRGGFNPTPEMLAKDPLCVQVTDSLPVLPVGDKEFKAPKPTVSALEYLDRIEGRLVRKVWCGNMRHCTTACIGQFRGHAFIADAAEDDYVRKIANYAMNEAMDAIGIGFGFTQAEMDDWAGDRWASSRNTTAKDKVERVAADPARKLARNDRFIGPALLCVKNGIIPFFLMRAAAYMFFFQNPEDKGFAAMHRMIAEQGIERTILHFCELDMDETDDRLLFDLLLGHYREIWEHEAAR